jgi:hypothetical protein
MIFFLISVLILVALFIAYTCRNFLDNWDSYEIKKGDHFSKRKGMPRRLVSLQDGRHMHFKAQFLSTCFYQPFYDDINKLYGFTDCNSSIHDNSIRFGWRHDGKGKIEIFAYWYANGKSGYHKLGSTEVDVVDDYELWAKGDKYYFRFNEIEFETPRSIDCNKGLRVRCFPYFGGDAPAPQQMSIKIYEFS